ncbi:MAG: hypothetical protein US69_C0009G0009 [candidate division TM6 bacterium GW2011_GWF2_38_10]|nr:MAG: hypothetical protein US69_C0009G0009 [candidate division TM6 bacterium GW2011_GWF2_38_10]
MQKMAWYTRLFSRNLLIVLTMLGSSGTSQATPSKKNPSPIKTSKSSSNTKKSTAAIQKKLAPSASKQNQVNSLIAQYEQESILQGKKIIELEETVADLAHEVYALKKSLAQFATPKTASLQHKKTTPKKRTNNTSTATKKQSGRGRMQGVKQV